MEAESLPDGRIKLVLSRRENYYIGYSLGEAIPILNQDDPEFRAHVGISGEETGSLDDEWLILRRKLFDLPEPQQYESEAMRAWLTEELERLSKGPRETGTSWDGLPKMEAELLYDDHIAYNLARGELSIFAGAMDVMLVKVARDRDSGSRSELSARSGGTIEEFEELRDDLWQADHRLRGKPVPGPLYNPLRPPAASGRVGDLAAFTVGKWRVRATRDEDSRIKARRETTLLSDGRIRLVVSSSDFACMGQVIGATIGQMYWDEPDFRGPAGVSFEEAMKLDFEATTIHRGLRGDPGWGETRNGVMVPFPKPKKLGSAWDRLPEMEAETLRGERVALILPLEKLAVFVSYLEIALTYALPENWNMDDERFERRFLNTIGGAEVLADSLWQVYEDLLSELAKREETIIGSDEDEEA